MSALSPATVRSTPTLSPVGAFSQKLQISDQLFLNINHHEPQSALFTANPSSATTGAIAPARQLSGPKIRGLPHSLLVPFLQYTLQNAFRRAETTGPSILHVFHFVPIREMLCLQVFPTPHGGVYAGPVADNDCW